jgi:hypothetical protein
MAVGDDHRDVGERADFAQEVERIRLADPTIEDHEVRLALCQAARHLVASSGRNRTHVVLAQIADDRLPAGRIFVDNQDSRRSAAVGSRQPGGHHAQSVVVAGRIVLSTKPAEVPHRIC